jgi:two-component system, chemotaxis family, protein-glutamate methylesterase/glutaminase
MVVDDSVVVRRLLSDAIASDPELEVMGTAASGRIALSKIESSSPDVITLDVEMPEMNGIETLQAIKRLRPTVPVLMCSGITERGAVATLEALAKGAADYITKPSADGRVDRATFNADLVSKLKALGRARTVAPPPSPAPRRLPMRAPATGRIQVLAIGVSTGGPNALARLMPMLPADLRVPVVIVQHMPPLFTRMLAERLSHVSALPCQEGAAGLPVQPGHVYIAPGDHHMTVTSSADGVRLATNQGPPENSCRPAVDVLFRSVAEVYGSGVLALVMTGMGQDGLRGCEFVRARGGQVMVQDQATSVVWGMPGYVAEAGLADEVLALDDLAPAIVRRVGPSRVGALL